MTVIAIDGRELGGRPTGVGRFLSHLLAAWERLPEAAAHEFVLYVPAFARASAAPRASAGEPPSAVRLPPGEHASVPPCVLRLPPGLPVRVRVVPGGSGTWWEQGRLASAVRRDRPDVLFCPAYTAPIATRVPVVVALHDVSFLAHPEWFPPRTGFRRRLLARLAARRAAAIFTISRFSCSEIVTRLKVPPGRVRVVPLAPGGPPIPQGVPREPMVLYVGSIFNRRHLPELMAACGRLAAGHPDVRLEVVGEDRTYPRQDLAAAAAASGLGDRLTLRSYLPDEDLARLYAKASAFAFLSDYEGFGLTPLEALAAGVPAVLGDTPVAREVCGEAASYVPTRDVGAIAASLESVLYDPATRDRLLAAAPATLSRYSWDRVGRDTLDVLLAAARGRG